jgi:hypothetical protein
MKIEKIEFTYAPGTVGPSDEFAMRQVGDILVQITRAVNEGHSLLVEEVADDRDAEAIVQAIKKVRAIRNGGMGDKYVRDPEYPCEFFDPDRKGNPPANCRKCLGDGHHMCAQCRDYADNAYLRSIVASLEEQG